MKKMKKHLKCRQAWFVPAIAVLFFLAFGLLSTATQAQVEQKQAKPEEVMPASEKPSIQQKDLHEGDPVFTVVDEVPEYRGGEEARMKFITENIKYPEEAIESGVEGRVFVTFVIEPDGAVTNAKVLRGIGGGCDEEALRVVESMPDWIPGKHEGEPVRVQFTMPIQFSLSKDVEPALEERPTPPVPEFKRLPVPEREKKQE